MSLAEQLIEHEGLVLHAYQDSRGYWTIGVGRLIDARLNGGITREEAYAMLDKDIGKHTKELRLFAWFDGLSMTRKNALIDMHFNLGHTRFRQFKKMIAAIVRSDFDAAADEMLRSKWSKQVGQRAKTLAQMMREG